MGIFENSILLFKITLVIKKAVSVESYLSPIFLKVLKSFHKAKVLSHGGLSPSIPPIIKTEKTLSSLLHKVSYAHISSKQICYNPKDI